MGIEHLGRLVILNGTQAAVEAESAALVELVFGRDTANGSIGYSVDGGVNWTWITSATDLATIEAGELATRFEPLTNGDPENPDLVFDPANGDVYMMEVIQ